MQDDLNSKNEQDVAGPVPPEAFDGFLAVFHAGRADAPDGLTPAEEKLLDAARRGLPCVVASVRPDEPSPDNRVRASFLALLARGGDDGAPLHENRLELHGAVIEGDVNLENARVSRPLWFRHCLISGLLIGRNGRFREFDFEDTKIGGADLRFAHIDGGVFLRRGFHALGEVDFTGAVITGALNCNGGRFENPGGKALNCGGARITGDVQLRAGFEAIGEVRFRRAELAGLLECNGASFRNPGGFAMRCGGAKVGGGVFLRDGFSAEGEVRFPGAEILGEFNCRGGVFANPGGVALACDNARIKSNVFLNDGFSAHGETRFAGAELGDLLECGGGGFINPAGRALNCERARIAGHVWLNRAFSAEGEVRLHSASIGGQLACGGRFINPGRTAINGVRAKIQGDALLSRGCATEGEIRFRGISVGGSFVCSGGSFSNPQLMARDGDGVGILANALYLSGAKIQGGLLLTGLYSSRSEPLRLIGSLDLTHVQAGSFADHPDGWPTDGFSTPEGEARGALALDGFIYGQFAGGAPTDAETRKRWLLRQQASHVGREFRPQPFEQLIKVLRAMGHDEHARQIAMLKQSLLLPYRINRSPWWSRPFVWLVGRLWGWLAGYGHRPHRLVVALAALWLICAGGYQLAANTGRLSPVDPQVWTNADLVQSCRDNWTTCPGISDSMAFNALVYSADVLLPIVDLRQRTAWTPQPGWARALSWAENILGSLGVLLLGAILGGLIKRD